MHCLNAFFPKWRDLNIHESSPGWDIGSRRMADECKSYLASQYDPSVPWGTIVETRMPSKTYRSENLEAQTFPDNTFDLMLTQDVFEHIMHPDKAIKEIARTLKPHGATLMTVPITRRKYPSARRARQNDDGTIEHIEDPQYHGNPMGGGSLVTIDWGYDIVRYFQAHSGLNFILLKVDNIDLGIRGDFNEVLIGFKERVPDLS